MISVVDTTTVELRCSVVLLYRMLVKVLLFRLDKAFRSGRRGRRCREKREEREEREESEESEERAWRNRAESQEAMSFSMSFPRGF